MAEINIETYQKEQIDQEMQRKEGFKEGQLQAKREIAITLLRSGADINMIVRVTGLSRASIKKLLQAISTSS